MTIILTLPFPPSANRLWRYGNGHPYKSGEYNDWLIEAGAAARKQKPGKVDGPYKISILATRPDKRRRDIDNLIKPISDLCQSIGIVKNDSDCELVSARWVTAGSDGVTVLIDRVGEP